MLWRNPTRCVARKASQNEKQKKPLCTNYIEALSSQNKPDLNVDVLDTGDLWIEHHMELAICDIEDARCDTVNQEVVVG